MRILSRFHFPFVCFCLCVALVISGCEGLEGDGGAGNGTSSANYEENDPQFSSNCTPSCAFKQCGNNGCGGSCGDCAFDEICNSFQCLFDDGTLSDESVIAPPDEDTAGPDTDGEPGVVEDMSDEDSDQVPASEDNCPTVYNPDQADMDEDWVGDVCDPDLDQDGYLNELDCEPAIHEAHPGADELCHNGIDDNCNSVVDEENASDCVDYFVDTDADGAGDSTTLRCLCGSEGEHTAKVGGDCDDTDPTYSPLLPEICDGLDNNCNELTDEGCDDDGDGYCDSAMVMVSGTPLDVCPKGGGDCYDYSALVNPEAVEIPANGIDDNCDGQLEGEPQVGVIEPDCNSMPCTGASLDAALCAMEICYGSQLSDVSLSSPTTEILTGAWDAIAHYGSASNDLAPFAGPSYFAMATGSLYAPASFGGGLPDGSGIACPAPWAPYNDPYAMYGDACLDPFASDGYEFNDAVDFKVDMVAPAGATGFSVDYIFMSQEYEEYIGTMFNDKFYIILQADVTTGGQPQVVNFTQCSDPNSYFDYTDGSGNKWCFIAINTAFSEPCSSPSTDISGTGYECSADGSSTGWLTTAWPIVGGEHFTLTFHIHDTSDESWDSAVIIDNFRFEGGVFESGTVTHN